MMLGRIGKKIEWARGKSENEERREKVCSAPEEGNWKWEYRCKMRLAEFVSLSDIQPQSVVMKDLIVI